MALWPGFHVLRQDSTAAIPFIDLKHLTECFSPCPGKIISASNEWGQQILDMCKDASPGDPDQVTWARLRGAARLLSKLLEALCFDEGTGSPHLFPGAELWNPADCPVVCKNRHVMNVYESYPKARLGVCHSEERQPYYIEVQLHRFACWLARGEPGTETPFACHSCHLPSCVRLHCLSWGNASTNQQDAYSRQPAKRRKRLVLSRAQGCTHVVWLPGCCWQLMQCPNLEACCRPGSPILLQNCGALSNKISCPGLILFAFRIDRLAIIQG